MFLSVPELLFQIYYLSALLHLSMYNQRCADGGVEGALPIFSNSQESWSKVSHAARELATVFSVTFLFVFSNNN